MAWCLVVKRYLTGIMILLGWNGLVGFWEKLHAIWRLQQCQAGMCSSGMLAGGDQTVITHSINA